MDDAPIWLVPNSLYTMNPTNICDQMQFCMLTL